MATGDPNAHKITDATQPGIPPLSSKTQAVVASEGLENVAIDDGEQSLEERCRFWASVAGSVPI